MNRSEILGQTDILARWVGEKIHENWGQQVVVDNRPSAGGTIASEYVLAADARINRVIS